MIVDQAEKLRLMVRKARKTARVITISSGKGGVGKTNIAANLAICLRATGKRVLLLDADLGLANLDVIFNVRPRLNLAHVISGQRHIDEITQRVAGGVDLICGLSGLADAADLSDFQRQRLLQELSTLEHQTDYIIIDTGAGISSNVMCFCDAADMCLIVTTPEPTSITDAYTLIKRISLNASGAKVSLLCNMAETRNEARGVYQRLSSTAQRFLSLSIADAGYILRDSHVSDAVNLCEPVVLAYPRCQASYCILALAGKVSSGNSRLDADSGFFRKVVNWFF